MKKIYINNFPPPPIEIYCKNITASPFDLCSIAKAVGVKL